MSERLTPEQEAELLRKAFAPGTLVHGMHDDLWLSPTLAEGITPTTFYGLVKLSVCTAILANTDNFRLSYATAFHEGPKGRTSSAVGFLLSPQVLMEKHPGLLGAIGSSFVSKTTIDGKEYSDFEKYNVDSVSRTAFGIPIYHEDGAHWNDEVRLYCKDSRDKVTPDMWKGIVVSRRNYPYLLKCAKSADYKFETPVFSTDFEVITTDLGSTVVLDQ